MSFVAEDVRKASFVFDPLMAMEEIVPQIAVRRNLAKRLFDLLFSATALILGIPLFLLISLLIKCTSRGPLFYQQERVGQGGCPFICYKFRSMFDNADERLQILLTQNPPLCAEWQATYKLKNDPRITKIGHFLRRTSLDELPQFWNVWKGDLSIVGPRPVVRFEVERYFGARAIKILSVKPGLTCFWQVSGRNNIHYAERLALDERYIDEQNFWLDMRLIIKTLPAIYLSRGAY